MTAVPSPDTALIVVPTYNERETLGSLIERLFAAVPRAEVLVVDDASPDGTGALADELAAADRRVHVLHRPGKQGMGTAYVAGFDWARSHGYGRVAQVDADGSHDPATLPALLARLEGADLVIGSRAIASGRAVGWGPHRLALSRMGCWYTRAWLGWSLTDPTSGFRALGPRALEALADRPPRSEGFAFQIETAFRVRQRGLEVVEHPICFVDREAGRSKMSLEIVAEALLVVPLLRLCALVGA